MSELPSITVAEEDYNRLSTLLERMAGNSLTTIQAARETVWTFFESVRFHAKSQVRAKWAPPSLAEAPRVLDDPGIPRPE